MKKLVIFICFIIPHLLIGQSKSLVITNKKNGKELNERIDVGKDSLRTTTYTVKMGIFGLNTIFLHF